MIHNSIQEIKQNWNLERSYVMQKLELSKFKFFLWDFSIFSSVFKDNGFVVFLLRSKREIFTFFRSLGYTMLISWKEGIFHSQQQY